MAPAAAQPRAEAFTLFRGHMAQVAAATPPMRAHETSRSAEQEPAQTEEPEGLPIGNSRQTEDWRHQPVPQIENRAAETRQDDGDEDENLEDQNTFARFHGGYPF